MESIKNIINYDPDVLAVQYDEAQDRYVNDPDLEKLSDRKDMVLSYKIPCLLLIMIVGLVVVMVGNIFSNLFVTIIGFLVMLSSLLFESWVGKHYKIKDIRDALNSIYDFYFSPALQFYGIVKDGTVLSCYGALTDDGEFFEVHLAAESRDCEAATESADKKAPVVEKTVVFPYYPGKSDGVLTLDVGGNLVTRA